MYRFLHLLFGEYTLCLRCEDPLPFLRLLTKNKVLFWSLNGGDGIWYLKTTLSNAEALLGCAGEAGIPAEIVRRKGLPFLTAKYKKRPGLLLGLFVGLALLFVSELFVWKVTVNGNINIPETEILQALEKQGIGVGSYIPRIPVLKAQNEFLLSYKDLSSVAINIKGTHIQVEVLERTHEPAYPDTAGICNVVASRDGVILSAKSSAGTVIVTPGEVVQAGQTLISAFSVGKRNVYRLHHARGTVMARVYEYDSALFPTQIPKKHYTGREKTKTVVSVLGKGFPLYLKEDCGYERFDLEVKKKPFLLFGFIETPIVVTSLRYIEYDSPRVFLTEKEIRTEAELHFRQWKGDLGDGIEKAEYTLVFDEIKSAYVYHASASVCMNIGIDMPLAIGEQPPEQVRPPDPVY